MAPSPSNVLGSTALPRHVVQDYKKARVEEIRLCDGRGPVDGRVVVAPDGEDAIVHGPMDRDEMGVYSVPDEKTGIGGGHLLGLAAERIDVSLQRIERTEFVR